MKQKNYDIFLAVFVWLIVFTFKFLITVVIPSLLLWYASKELGYEIHYSIIGKVLFALWFIAPIFSSKNNKVSIKDLEALQHGK